MERYINCEKPSLNTFQEMLFVVKRCQGYADEEAREYVKNAIELNQMIDEMYFDNTRFFKEEINKKK